MAIVDGPKYLGPHVLDLSDVKSDLVDLPPGATRGIRSEQPNMDKVIAELAKVMPAAGDAAEIAPQVYQRFAARVDLIAKLRAHVLTQAKLYEVTLETLAKAENDQEDDLSIIARAAQDAARRKKDAGITAPFEETIKYNSQIAEKAVQTRKKNAEAKAEAANNAAGQGDGQTPPGQGGGQTPPA